MTGQNYPVEFGEMSYSQLQNLYKALGTGTGGEAYGGDSYADMSALRPQSLEPTLRIVTAREQHFKLWNTIGKGTAFNTVEEFNVLDSYGGDYSPFYVEGGLPSETDSNYIRRSELVKFMGTTRVITNPALAVRTVPSDVLALETRNGILWLLQKVEQALFFADESIDPLAFNGIYAQVRNFLQGKPEIRQHIIDMRGQPLDEAILEDAATVIADNYGNSNLQLYLTRQVHKDLSKILIGSEGRQRVLMLPGNNQSNSVWMGQPVRGYAANYATIEFMDDVFLKQKVKPLSKADKGAPASPTAAASDPVVAVADDTSLMEAGDYYYFVSARNSQGESEPAAIGDSVTVAEGQRVDITINRVVSDPVATSYKVYRSKTPNAEDAQFLFEVKDAGAGTTQTISDYNFDMPDTDMAFLIDNDPENVLRFKQLLPMMREPLAKISDAERFMIRLYGMLQVYNPRRIVIFKNIGKLGLNSNRPLFEPSYGADSYGTIRPVTKGS